MQWTTVPIPHNFRIQEWYLEPDTQIKTTFLCLPNSPPSTPVKRGKILYYIFLPDPPLNSGTHLDAGTFAEDQGLDEGGVGNDAADKGEKLTFASEDFVEQCNVRLEANMIHQPLRLHRDPGLDRRANDHFCSLRNDREALFRQGHQQGGLARTRSFADHVHLLLWTIHVCR